MPTLGRPKASLKKFKLITGHFFISFLISSSYRDDPKINRTVVIQLIVYDFDGVMTDNRVILREDGLESVVVNRSDGLAVGIIKSMGIPQLILSKEKNPVAIKRAEKLGIPIQNGIDDKKEILMLHCKNNGIDLKKVVYLGNDLNDVDVANIVGYPMCPEDAYPEFKAVSRFVIPVKGGCGVIRYFLNWLLKKESDE